MITGDIMFVGGFPRRLGEGIWVLLFFFFVFFVCRLWILVLRFVMLLFKLIPKAQGNLICLDIHVQRSKY